MHLALHLHLSTLHGLLDAELRFAELRGTAAATLHLTHICPLTRCLSFHDLKVDRSFENFKELLLTHSVQRPPFSIGLFTFTEMKAIMAWALDTYYRHYKLYMYAFTDRCVGQLGGKSPTTALRLTFRELCAGCLIGCERQ